MILENTMPVPAPTRAYAHDCPEADRIVEDAIRGVGADIDALHIPLLLGVVLGGGYARGEGGVILGQTIEGSNGPTVRPSDRPTVRLSNDLDFYVVAEDKAGPDDLARIAEALRPVSEKWTAALGVDADFSPPKTPWRIRHDEERVMIQELIHGYCDVAGKSGEELFAGVERRPPEAFPIMEATRLVVNRGVGLLLAAEAAKRSQGQESADGDEAAGFVARNINKVILGCGDARLIARGGYRWRAVERAEALGDELYARAVRWKFRPQPEPPCDWEAARTLWLETAASLANAHGDLRRRTPRAAARWLVRRRSLGPAPLLTLGLDPLVRILRALVPLVRDRRPLPPALRRDWEVFN